MLHQKIRGEKLGVPDYGLEDEDEGLVPDDQKQIEPNPPTYEESLNNIFGENVPPLKKRPTVLRMMKTVLRMMKTVFWMMKTVLRMMKTVLWMMKKLLMKC